MTAGIQSSLVQSWLTWQDEGLQLDQLCTAWQMNSMSCSLTVSLVLGQNPICLHWMKKVRNVYMSKTFYVFYSSSLFVWAVSRCSYTYPLTVVSVCVGRKNSKEKYVLDKPIKNGCLSHIISQPAKSVACIFFIGFYSCRCFSDHPINYPPGMIKLDCAVILHYVPVVFHVMSLNDWWSSAVLC